MMNREFFTVEENIIVRELEHAINYAFRYYQINQKLLEYFRLNMAEDSRYTFQFMGYEFEFIGIGFVKYRKKVYTVKYDKKLHKLAVLSYL